MYIIIIYFLFVEVWSQDSVDKKKDQRIGMIDQRFEKKKKTDNMI